MIKVSVIVPAYNVEGYIEQCLDSLVKQTMDEVEIIVVDDGSTDNTLAKAKEFEEKFPQKVKVYYQKNGGQASARNLALLYSTGEYLGFVDSDDWVDTDMYEKMYQKAKIEDADIVICDMIDHYPQKEIYHHSSLFEDRFCVTPSACNKIFRKNFASDVLFPEGLWYEDFEYTTKQLMKTEKISVIHEGFYHCHCREVSTMNNNNSEKNKDILTVLEHLEEFVEKKGWENKYADVMEYLYIDHILITTINRLEKQTGNEKKQVIKFLRKKVLEKYPHFYRDNSFRSIPRKRQLIAYLNARGLSYLSKMILDMKAKL